MSSGLSYDAVQAASARGTPIAFSAFCPQGEMTLQQELVVTKGVLQKAQKVPVDSIAFYETTHILCNLPLIRDFEQVSLGAHFSPGSRLDQLNKFNLSNGKGLTLLNSAVEALRTEAKEHIALNVQALTNYDTTIDAETDATILSQIATEVEDLKLREKLCFFEIPKDKDLESAADLLLEKCKAKIHAIDQAALQAVPQPARPFRAKPIEIISHNPLYGAVLAQQTLQPQLVQQPQQPQQPQQVQQPQQLPQPQLVQQPQQPQQVQQPQQPVDTQYQKKIAEWKAKIKNLPKTTSVREFDQDQFTSNNLISHHWPELCEISNQSWTSLNENQRSISLALYNRWAKTWQRNMSSAKRWEFLESKALEYLSRIVSDHSSASRQDVDTAIDKQNNILLRDLITALEKDISKLLSAHADTFNHLNKESGGGGSGMWETDLVNRWGAFYTQFEQLTQRKPDQPNNMYIPVKLLHALGSDEAANKTLLDLLDCLTTGYDIVLAACNRSQRQPLYKGALYFGQW